jgi:NAD-dependent dihydropyrimidine dehydrogenase PreA subunit
MGAEKCGACMHICPMGVFMNVPVGKFVPGKMAEKFEIVPFFLDQCNACGACVKVCKERAIAYSSSPCRK